MTLSEAIAEITRLEPLATPRPWQISGASITTDVSIAEVCIANIEDDGGYEAPSEQRDTNAALIALLRNVIVPLLAEQHAMRGALDRSLFGMDAKESREWEAQACAALNLANQPLP